MKKILAIIDNSNDVIVLTALLSNAILTTALSSLEGVEKAFVESPDMILLDLGIPVVDGIETCKKLKENTFLKQIPIIMITSCQPDSKIRTTALESGVEAFLSKPIDEAELITLISSITRLKNLENLVFLSNEKFEELVKVRTCELEQELVNRTLLVEALQESEERYRALFDRSLDCVFILDFKGHFIDANNAALNMFGYKRDEIQGLSFLSLLSDDQSPLVFKTQNDIREIGFQKGLTEFRLKDRNGKDVYIETQGSAVFSKGTAIAIQYIGRNTTERKRSENELRKLSRAVEQSPVSIIITDLNGSIVYANPKVCELTGYSIGEILGKNTRIFQSGETQKETYKELWDTILSGKEWQCELHNRKKNGELYWESISISPILDTEGKMVNFLSVREDITELKKLIITLEEAKDKAEASNQLKSAFIYNISHEVRTPLNGILGFSNLLMQSDITEEEKEEYHTLIKISSNRLLNTIINYMDISLIVSRNMEVNMTPFNPDYIFHQLFEHFRPVCEESHLALNMNIPQKSECITLYSDAELLYKALSHLLDNAVKFTPQGGITFGYIMSFGSLEFFVKDTGNGITSEAQNRIFENFVQENVSLNRGHEGSGLGLSIASGFIRLIGGEIRVESAKGKGSSFFFTLPCEKITSNMKSEVKVNKLSVLK